MVGSRCASWRVHREFQRKTIPPGRDRIIGGDMEGLGLLSVSPADKPLWAVVKGISDFADEDRDGIKEATRPLACENAVHRRRSRPFVTTCASPR
jgi:adenosylhomocysteine nucleosidase